jgi:hypothetical protein
MDETGGTQYPYLPGGNNWTNLMLRAGNTFCDISSSEVVVYREERFSNGTQTSCGSQVAVRGEPAVPSGIPGGGGRGGILRSTLNLAPHAQLDGGAPGATGGNYAGGTLFFPYIYLFTTIEIVKGEFKVTTTRTQAPKLPGVNASAPLGSVGAAGSVVVTDSGAWLHSFSARSIVQFAKNAYLNGRTSEARALATAYRDAIRVLQPAVESVTMPGGRRCCRLRRTWPPSRAKWINRFGFFTSPTFSPRRPPTCRTA